MLTATMSRATPLSFNRTASCVLGVTVLWRRVIKIQLRAH